MSEELKALLIIPSIGLITIVCVTGYTGYSDYLKHVENMTKIQYNCGK